MSNCQIYCALCGGPMLYSGLWPPDHWLKSALLLTSAHPTPSGPQPDIYEPPQSKTAYAFDLDPTPLGACSLILRLPAHATGKIDFCLRSSDECVQALRVTEEGPLYIPVHEACLQIADKLITTNALAALDRDVTSEMRLWHILQRRMEAKGGGDGVTWLPEPHGYFAGKACRNVEWEPRDDEEAGRMMEADPVDVPDVTEGLLALLKATEEETAEQRWHREALVRGELLPWLWDIDVAMVERKTGAWGWAQLVKRLASREVYEDRELTLGLRNRRRIWRILQEARVDDVAEPAEQERMAFDRGKNFAMSLFGYNVEEKVEKD